LSEFEWVAAAIVAAFSAARITRLVTWDKFPPSVWLRMKYAELTHDGPWTVLVECGYCFGVYAAGFVLGWGLLSDFHWTWWAFNGWMALAYAAAIIMAFDGDEG
jgi:drug/metabolite transporter (DMT)-like permease